MGDDASHCISIELETMIHRLLHPGDTILELGSGSGTARLAEDFNMISVEHDEKFVGLHRSTYIHAPIQPFRKPCGVFSEDTGWYDRDVLRRELPRYTYDLLLIDGPPNYIGRGGAYKWREMFDLEVPIIFDDAHRMRTIKLMQRFSADLKRPFTVYGCWSDRHFGVMLP